MQRNNNFIMIFEIIRGGGGGGGELTGWGRMDRPIFYPGKEWAGLFFTRGKNGPAHSFPGEKLTGGNSGLLHR